LIIPYRTSAERFLDEQGREKIILLLSQPWTLKAETKNISLSEREANKKVDFLCLLSANYVYHRCSNA
jgi:hypothetical protein